MDTQTDSNGALDINQGAAAFSALFDPPETQDKTEPVEESPIKVEPEAEEAQATPDAEAETSTEDDPVVTVKVDGKDVEVKLSDLKKSYSKDAAAHQRFDQAAEMRKTADAELQRAQQERLTYAQNLQRLQAQTEAALQEQQKIDWQALLNADPIEYLKQKELSEQRQNALNQVYARQRELAVQAQAEQAEYHGRYLQEQNQALLEKLPAWRDAEKAKADKIALKEYLMKEGYDEQSVSSISDAKAVLLARKAMLYDQMMGKASAAAKKISGLPTKVERPGTGDNPGLDRRGAAFQKLSKSGRMEDAAAVFAGIL